ETKEEQQRDFVHTVEVLLASALAQRELARTSRGLSGQLVRRTGPHAGQPVAFRPWPAVAAAILALVGGTYGAYEYSRWQPPVVGQRIAEATDTKKRVNEERARQDAEAKRLAEVTAAEKQAAEERAGQEARVKRLVEAVERRAAVEEGAHQE